MFRSRSTGNFGGGGVLQEESAVYIGMEERGHVKELQILEKDHCAGFI